MPKKQWIGEDGPELVNFGSSSRVLTKADTSTADSVICAGCQRRFIGGPFASRILRWKQHADEDGCG